MSVLTLLMIIFYTHIKRFKFSTINVFELVSLLNRFVCLIIASTRSENYGKKKINVCVGNCGGPLVVEYFLFFFFFSFAGGGELLIYVTMTTDERDVHCLVGSTVCILYTLRWRKKKTLRCVSPGLMNITFHLPISIKRTYNYTSGLYKRRAANK